VRICSCVSGRRDRRRRRLCARDPPRAAADRGATLGFRANPRGGTLNVAILPTFGTQWLDPRLPKFLSAQPGVTINLTTRLAPFEFQVDASRCRDPLQRTGMAGYQARLPHAACSTPLRASLKLSKPADLLRAPLVHLVSRPDAWKRWLRAAGVDFDEVNARLSISLRWPRKPRSPGSPCCPRS
jgi:LysR family glycine cleavage system transcriptional activator